MSYLSKNNALKVLRVTSLPTTGEEGNLYLNTTSKTLHLWEKNTSSFYSVLKTSDFVYDYYAKYSDIVIGSYDNVTRNIIVLIDETDGNVMNTYQSVNGVLKKNLGKSAYQVALDNGFVGTEAEWVNQLNTQVAIATAQATIATNKANEAKTVGFQGTWNASTNSPTLTTTPNAGFVDGAYYDVVVAGTQSITGSSVTFGIGDQVKKVGTTWVRIPNSSRIDNLGDTSIANKQDGDIIQYSSASGLFKNVLRHKNSAPSISVQKDITPSLQEGYLIPDYSYPEANVNYRIASYLVEVGKTYRLIATITTPARGNGSGGAYCLYNTFNSPTNGGIVQQPQLTTKEYDVLITIPAGVTYIRVTQKIVGDSNMLSEVITTPSLATSIATEKGNILDYLVGVALGETIQDGIVLWNTTSAINNSSYKASFFPVIAGRKYRIKGQFTTPDANNANIAFYCFFTSATYTAGITGTLVNQNATTKTYDIVVTAPSTASYIGISQLKSTDVIVVSEVIQQNILSPVVAKAVVDISSNLTKIEANTALLSRQISAVYREGYVIPNYLWEEVDANYKVAKYPVLEGKSYRLQAQVTSKAVAQGTMGAYCWFSQLEVPMTGQITTQPQLTTRLYDVVLTPPVGAKYLCVSQKLVGGDYNTFVELISTPSLKLKLDSISSDNVTCWGDSITWGSAPEDGNYWTKLLQQVIGTSKLVINCGVGGEGAVNIPMRQGAIPMYNSIEFTLPSDTTTVPVGRIDNWIYGGFFKSSYNDEPCSFLLQGEGRDFNTINPCFVDGIECTLSYVRESTNPEQGQYYIKRNVAGTARTIKVGTPVITNAAKNLKQDITILFMGTNDGWVDANDLINRYKKMIEFADVGKKYLIIGIYGGVAKTNHNLNKAGFEALEKAMFKEFGLHFINLRKYCVEQGLVDAGITPTTADNNAIALGDMPPSLLADSVHPNSACSILIKNLIYNRMQNLGFI